MTACAYAKSGKRVGYFATTYTQARDIAWEMLKTITRPVWSKAPNETRLELRIRTQDKGESEIVLKGWESVETSRGTQFDLLVLDEVAKMRNFRAGWEGALMATLAFRNGSAMFISTPAGYNHFYDLYKLGQESSGLWKSWRFTSFDNPFLSREWLESIHTNATEDFWQQEYLADFRRFTGLIYKEFDIATHVHDFEFEKNQHADYYFGLDFAVRGWTASVPGFVKTDGDLYIPDTYKVENLTAQQHSAEVKTMLERYADLPKYSGFADPSGFAKNQRKGDMLWSLADDYLEAGLPIAPANNEVTAGINHVRQLFRNNKIHIHPRCTPLIDEILQYQWKDQTEKQKDVMSEPEKVRKVNDHLVDSMRYMAFSKPDAAEALPEERKTVFPVQFPPPRIEEPDENGDQFVEIEIPSVYDM